MKLHKYWFKFAISMNDPHPLGTLAGCGVTAVSYEDALDVMRSLLFKSDSLPAIERWIEDVELSDLDLKHVVPNIGDSSKRGIWFPQGYDGCVSIT